MSDQVVHRARDGTIQRLGEPNRAALKRGDEKATSILPIQYARAVKQRCGRALAVADNHAGEGYRTISEEETTARKEDVVALYAADAANQDLLRRVSELPALPEGWREYFRKRLWEPDA